jgi:hypothetical protein
MRLAILGAHPEVFASIYAAGGDIRDAMFQLGDAADGLNFLRRLAHADIDYPGTIKLGVANESFVLGPDVFVRSAAIQAPSANLRVIAGEEMLESVIIMADAFQHTGSIPELLVRGRFGVFWPDLSYPWIEHAYRTPTERPTSPQIAEVNRYLTRILRLFRSHGYGGLSRHPDVIHLLAIGKSKLAADLLQFMIDEGLVVAGGLYSLNLERMNELGIHWVDVRNREMSDGVEAFITKFLQARAS